MLHLQGDFYGGWLHTGRQGLVFLKYLFGNAQFNPYFSGIMTLLLFTAAVAAFLGLWSRTGGGSGPGRLGVCAWGSAALLWISHPAMAEQFYFSVQSMEICMAMILTALALYLSFQWTGGRGFPCAAAGVGILVLTFSSYQIFVVLYIFGTVTVLLLQALQEISGGAEITGKILLKRIIPYCTVFLVAFLLNTLITRLFFSSSGYLQNQIFWGRASTKDCLHAIAGHILKALTGYDSIFYNPVLGVLVLFDLILLTAFLTGRCKGKRGVCLTVLFFYAAVLVTPFMMTVVLGGTPAIRSQMVLPAATGFLGYLGIRLLQLQAESLRGRRGQVLLVCAAAICLAGGLEQAKVTETLYYTDSCRYEYDAALGRSVIERIEQANQEAAKQLQEEQEGQPDSAGQSYSAERLPVVVVGSRDFTGNNSCLVGEVIGRSFFDYDTDVGTEFFWSTRRILGFLHTLGADYNQVPEEWMGRVREYSENMPAWPAEGCVQAIDGMIIVKLSD